MKKKEKKLNEIEKSKGQMSLKDSLKNAPPKTQEAKKPNSEEKVEQKLTLGKR